MDSETVERVSEWESEGFTGGYEGLRALADREFTGAVSDGRAWLFVLNGRVVGVADGDLEGFAEAEGTAYHAPHPSLPLLFAMRERGGETRAKYYTEDTPLSEADRTLSSGNFTGYVELSENVLSGDYYVVYHGGESMAAAFVGNSRELLTGDEAFDRADGEVGIYEVTTVDVDVREIPDRDETGGSGAAAAAGGAAAASGAVDGAGSDGSDGDDPGGNDGVTNDVGTDAGDLDASAADDSASDAAADPPDGEAGGPSTDGPVPGENDDDDATATSTSAATADVESDDSDAGESTSSTVGSSSATGSAPDSATNPGTSGGDRSTAERSASDDAGPVESSSASRTDAEVFEEEAQWRETTTIPALDPDDADGEADEDGAAAAAASASTESTEATEPAQGTGTERTGELRGRIQNLETKLSQVAEERDELRAERDRLQARIDELQGERDAARERVSELESRVERLENELEAATADAGGGGAGAAGSHEQTMSPAQALSGTNLFVRYDSKGRETLEDVAGGADRDEVNRNLRLETHTGFESEDVVVDGQPYEAWLAGTVEYGFARWVVQDLPYEIRDTDGVAKLRDLYDALPNLDRIEFDGQVAAESEQGASRQFDVVCRDRMGDPLVVANLNDSLDAATEGQMSDLVEAAQAVGQAHDSLAAAFSVTSSYFAPEALETADEATGGGLLSRDRRESFVRLARKQGFHLCLVETRNGEYHVNVPEL